MLTSHELFVSWKFLPALIYAVQLEGIVLIQCIKLNTKLIQTINYNLTVYTGSHAHLGDTLFDAFSLAAAINAAAALCTLPCWDGLTDSAGMVTRGDGDHVI